MHTVDVGERPPVFDEPPKTQPPYVADFDPPEPKRRIRWALVAVVALAWLLTIVLAFEIGHAYAEGARSLPAFGEHLGDMYDAYVGAWLWRAPTAWLW